MLQTLASASAHAPLPQPWSPEERRARIELACLYRLVAHYRMTDLIDTHISARIPGPEHHFLINRYGVLFGEMQPEHLVKVDAQGQVVDPAEDAAHNHVNVAGFVIHSAVHTAREDLACVVHTHTADGIAVSAQQGGLLPISQHALRFYRRIGYHDYEGIALEVQERERLVRDLGPHKAMILRNHGLLAAGGSIPEAFHVLLFLERACQAQIKAQAGGGALNLPSPEVCERTAQQFDRPAVPEIIRMAWNAALRELKADDAHFITEGFA